MQRQCLCLASCVVSGEQNGCCKGAVSMVQSFKGNYFRLPLFWSQTLTIINELEVCFIQKQLSFWAPSVLCHVNWSVIKRKFWYSKNALLVLKCCSRCTHTKATLNCLNLQSKFCQGSEEAQAAWSASVLSHWEVTLSAPSEWTEIMVLVCSFQLVKNN